MFYDIFFDKNFATVNRSIRDTHPYDIIKYDNKDVIIVNALGVSENDIEIKIKQDGDKSFLYIKGETENSITNTKYSFSNRFSINKIKIKEIKYYTLDGLLYVEIEYKEEENVDIPISKI